MERDELYRRLAGSQLHADPGMTPTAAEGRMEPWAPPPSFAAARPPYAGLVEQTLQLRLSKSEEQW